MRVDDWGRNVYGAVASVASVTIASASVTIASASATIASFLATIIICTGAIARLCRAMCGFTDVAFGGMESRYFSLSILFMGNSCCVWPKYVNFVNGCGATGAVIDDRRPGRSCFHHPADVRNDPSVNYHSYIS